MKRKATPDVAVPTADRWRSRARIGAAAAASVLLHLALARGLALTSVRVSSTPPREADAAAPKPRRETADYTLQAPRRAAARRPAYERPVAVAPVSPSAPPQPGTEDVPPIASWQPREAALLAQLTARPPQETPLPRPVAPARSTPDGPGPTRAVAPAAGAGTAIVAGSPRPAPATAPLTAPADAVVGGGGAPPSSASILEGMAATASEVRRRGPQPAASAPARRSVVDGMLEAARPKVALSPSDAGPGAAADLAPSPRPELRPVGGLSMGLPAAGAVLQPFATSRRSPEDEELSVADALAPGLDAAVDAVAAVRPRAPGRVEAVTLPTAPRAREVADAYLRRGRRDATTQADTPAAVEAAVQRRADQVIERGLLYLALSQEPDGRWTLAGKDPAAPRLRSDAAATGLALLSFFGAGHDHYAGPHRDTIRRGIEFLLASQQADGDLYESADRLSDSCAWLYSHAIATMALCEAVGMTGDPVVRPAAERACRFIAASQHPTLGGWRYRPGTDADLSVSGWMLVALRAGVLAGLEIDTPSLDRVSRLLDAASGTSPAAYAYNPRFPGQRPSRASGDCMTAVGTLMRLHTGWRPDDPRVTTAARQLEALRPTYGSATDRRRDAYLWYYASQVLVHTGGDGWETWYRALVDTLEPAQEREGTLAGSWDPAGPRPDRWGTYGGRLYVTALHLLALEVPDRRLPTLTATE